MKKSARVVLEKDEYVYLIKRNKKVNGSVKEYIVIPGGCLEQGETFEQAAIREIKEELSVDIELEEMFYEEYNEDLDKEEKYFFAKIKQGTVKPGKGEEFKNQSIDNPWGTYKIIKVRKSEIASYNILPSTVRDILASTYA